MDLNELRKFAGMQLKEDAPSKEHMKHETSLFSKAHKDLAEVERMCSERLDNPDLTPEQKKQYTDLRNCAKGCCEDMQKHLNSYPRKA